ncbi:MULTISPECIES: NAD-dependent protein deacetylase [unclassified Micromonospora]|uniref:NAD-dependent protein deacetylase n=1 Tax=unclassified Micromonospora TaxID=2617518 RepID=UPI00098D6023|nr:MULTISPECIES: NAD-dependent protein deacetylase [unclassified Micromonospora]MDI5939344.1 NAD-dependent protein deacetylase [Micromonospora sp. DH15]OON27289.1 NAD-dependent deacetylase [Micromonospora sp. Rc5]
MDDVTQTIDAVAGLLAGGGVVVLSGAGLSTDSGIPDYRGPSGVARRHTPMTFQAFTGDPAARRRYWARSHLGWRTIARAAPNDGHAAVARLQHAGLVDAVITQNVDGLHTAAGSTPVVELHGSLDAVVCLDCGDRTAREELDRRLREANPGFSAAVAAVNPDGDVDLPDAQVARFRPVDCERCRTGMLKPDVVFFGETVPPARVAACFDLVQRARAVLVLGSSLTVMSGRRFVIRAAKQGIPVAIVNQGPTRGDGYATVRVDAPLGGVLPELADRLTTRAPLAVSGADAAVTRG